ncbi:MAG: hypothetical protein ACOYJ1_03745 [Peptococcales bacterium]
MEKIEISFKKVLVVLKPSHTKVLVIKLRNREADASRFLNLPHHTSTKTHAPTHTSM